MIVLRVDLVDPSAYTPPYDHALAVGARASGAHVRLFTSEFAYGSVPAPDGYEVVTHFYRHALGAAGHAPRAGSPRPRSTSRTCWRTAAARATPTSCICSG